MKARYPRDKPKTWADLSSSVHHRWVLPFIWLEHKMDWLAYLLGNWKFLDVLEYLGSFGVLIAVVFYFAEAGDRLKQKHYQAWQVINSAQGKGGNGGRIEAVEELNADGVPLVGVDLSSAFLVGVRLPKANLARADFDGADVRGAVIMEANLDYSNLRSSNFRGARLKGSSLQHSVLNDSDFTEANLEETNLSGASLEDSDLLNAELRGVKWENIKSIKNANIEGVRNAPKGFVEWALQSGAIKKLE